MNAAIIDTKNNTQKIVFQIPSISPAPIIKNTGEKTPNKTASGKNNICGENIAKYRKDIGISQRKLADNLQLIGLDIDKNAIQRIESGQRFITDIEIVYFCKVFDKTFEQLFCPFSNITH